ncbi:MAG TPA: sugar phosphate isomerase/epimerase family protein [Candidatus Sulfotelmatobacter sp.]
MFALLMVTRRTFLAAAAAALVCPATWGRTRPVNVGVCTRDVAGAAKYGFDYVEPAAAEIAAMSEDQFREFSDTVLASPVRCHAFNSFIRRPDLKVVGPKVSTSALKRYLEQCLPRCRRLGASVVVWGSAGSRNVPGGFPRKKAQDQIAAFLKMAGDAARRNQVIVAVEPLRRQESNILNTGGEALEMVRRVNHPNIRMIIDYFHLREENEDPQIIEVGRREIVHLHFANPHGRVWPHDLAEDDHYAAFFGYLKKTGYSGGISIEGEGSFEKDGKASRDFFRHALV